jgi:hypothetical protein
VGAIKGASESSPIALHTAAQPKEWFNLLLACAGLQGAAENISRQLQAATQSDEGILCKLPGTPGVWQPVSDAENLNTPPAGLAIGAYGDRFAGMRPVWHSTDPAVIRFTAELFAYEHLIPPPDQAIVAKASSLGLVERVGNVVAIDGVPFPAGRRQMAAFLAIRYRWLLDPSIVCDEDDVGAIDDDDATHDDYVASALRHLSTLDLSDHSLMQLLGYNATNHRENLAKLQHFHLPLFWAVWRNDFREIEQISAKIGTASLSKWLIEPDYRFKGMMRDPALRLLLGTAIFAEFARLFEILEYLHSLRSITRQSIRLLLNQVPSLGKLVASGSPTAKYLLGSFAQIRGSHPTMNRFVPGILIDGEIGSVRSAVKNTHSYEDTSTRLACPFRETPALYFIGIEQQFIPLAAIILMIANMKDVEGEYLRRRTRGGDGAARNENEAVRLAAIIAANVHPRWARALLNAVDDVVSDQDWLEMGMTGTVKRRRRNGVLDESLKAPKSDEVVGLRNHYRLYGAVAKRVAKLPKVREPGWTRCFYFAAWFPSSAEIQFLTSCATFQKFSPDAAQAHQVRMMQKHENGCGRTRRPCATPNILLPRENPVETQHNRMRPFIEQLQFPDLLHSRFKVGVKTRDVFVREVADLLPAVTPFTLDPHLNEQIRFDVDEKSKDFAIEGAWHTTRLNQ